MPIETRSEHQTQRHAANIGEREGGHDQAHCRPTPMFRYDVPDDGENQRASDAAERAGKRACRYEHMICLGESAEKRSQRESGIEGQESTLPVKAVEKKAGGDARDTRADSVGGNDDAKS